MTLLQFVASLVQSITWPFAMVAVVFLFRGKIRDLLGGGLRRLKAGPVEMEWERVLADAEAVSEAVEVSPIEDRDVEGPHRRWRRDGPEDYARDLISESFRRITNAYVALLNRHGMQSQRYYPMMRSDLSKAVSAGLIDPETEAAINGLRELRNLSRRGEPTSSDQAVRYALTAGGIANRLERRDVVDGIPRPTS